MLPQDGATGYQDLADALTEALDHAFSLRTEYVSKEQSAEDQLREEGCIVEPGSKCGA